MTQLAADPLLAHLRSCCMRVIGEKPGCGFFVAPKLLITCSHVLGSIGPVGATVEVISWGNAAAVGALDGSWGARNNLSFRAEVLANNPADDLALLHLSSGDHPQVALDSEVRVGDELLAIGFPREGQRLEMDQFTAEFEGEVPYIDLHGHSRGGIELKFKGGQVRHGFSGGPLLNRRTWRVIGVVAVTRDARSPQGGFAKPLAYVGTLFKEAGQALASSLDPRWTDAEALQRQCAQRASDSLTPEQLLQVRKILQVADESELQQRIKALSAELGKERFAIRLALRQLGASSKDIPEEKLARRLLESTEAFERVFRATMPVLEDPEIANVFQRGQQAGLIQSFNLVLVPVVSSPSSAAP